MKFTTQLEAIQPALSSVCRASAARGVRPVLADVLVVAEPGMIRLTATDLEIMVTATVPAEVDSEGQGLIPAKTLLDVVSGFTGGRLDNAVEFSAGENDIVITSGRSKATLPLIGTEDFPPVPAVSCGASFEIPAADLAAAMAPVLVAVGSDCANPVQQAVCAIFQTGVIRFVATDSKRMAVAEMQAKYPEEFTGNYLIPGRAAVEVLKLDPDNPVVVGKFENQLVFDSGNIRLITRLYEGRFPDYARILPKESKNIVTFKTADMRRALKAVSPVQGSARMVNFGVDTAVITVICEEQDKGKIESTVDCDLNGVPFNIAFNAKYLAQALDAIKAESVTLSVNTPAMPGLIRPVQDAYQYRHVIMPMTI